MAVRNARAGNPGVVEATGSATRGRLFSLVLLVLLAAAPFMGLGIYPLHLMIMALLWGFLYTSWALMGRLGLVSLGHGAFFGVGAYAVVLLWNLFGWPPLAGALAAVVLTAILTFVVGYPCFRFKIVGHYFALVTLALAEVVRLVIVAMRDTTGGSLGITPDPGLVDGATASIWALQFSSKLVWFYVVLACWLLGLYVWHLVDRSMSRLALQAISEEEDAAASIGIDVTRTKLLVSMISAVMTCLGGVLYAQYQLYVNPETVAGVGVSLQMVFGAIAGGMFVMLGPTVGAVFLLLLSEGLRILVGNEVLGLDMLIYGALLVFDEVMSGFRVALGGAQQLVGVVPDISVFGKVIGGGMPVGAIGGPARIMDHMAPLGNVYQAGTLSGNPVAMAAGLATIELISRPGFFDEIGKRCERLIEGLNEAGREAGVAFCAQHRGALAGMYMLPAPPTSFEEVQKQDLVRFRRFYHLMLDDGIYLPPSPVEAFFFSGAHSEEDVDHTLAAAQRALAEVA
ncbi:MAG: aminotransferase class III-fold pyridoxal phosphate-dependent enzyme [Gammaproteobacteria bacterium]